MTQAAKTERPKKSMQREILEWVVCFAVALAIYFVSTTFLFKMIRVDGESMLQTLHNGERMFASVIDMKIQGPKRFDVVICNYPNPRKPGYRVKRVIGLPGETVECRDGNTYINGERIDEPFITDPRRVNYGPMTVPMGSYFVMGDNRNHSSDSTDSSVGPLERDLIVAKARAVWWPLNEFRIIQ